MKSENSGFPILGVGTMLWRAKDDNEKENLFSVYRYCVDNGLDFFDTAEVYGEGESEKLLGEFINLDKRTVLISSKFAPPSSMNPMAPKRKIVDTYSPIAIEEALDGTLKRLGKDCIEMYFMHTPPKRHSIKEYMDVMADQVRQGKIRRVGVCNFSASQIEEASVALNAHGMNLSAAMAGYNIVRRYPETNGVFDVCKANNITFIPYAPLAEGALTGKYRDSRVPFQYFIASYFGHLNITKEHVDNAPLIKMLLSKPRECDKKRMEPILKEMERIGFIHGKSMAQVALNWLLETPEVNIFPIPGMRSVKQVRDNIGAIDWKMTDKERNAICEAEESTR